MPRLNTLPSQCHLAYSCPSFHWEQDYVRTQSGFFFPLSSLVNEIHYCTGRTLVSSVIPLCLSNTWTDTVTHAYTHPTHAEQEGGQQVPQASPIGHASWLVECVRQMALLGLCARARWHRDGTEFFSAWLPLLKTLSGNTSLCNYQHDRGSDNFHSNSEDVQQNTACGPDQLARHTVFKQKVKPFSNTQMCIYTHSNHLKQIRCLL